MARSSHCRRRRRRRAVRAVALAAGATWVVAGVGANLLRAQTVTASWLSAVSGNWTDGTKWSTSPDYPNNNGTTNYNAAISPVGSPYTIGLFDPVNLGTVT